tara:strand:- start:445 stop:624 length:180 start_codon:yes stop_codon:yes gene_type:complete
MLVWYNHVSILGCVPFRSALNAKEDFDDMKNVKNALEALWCRHLCCDIAGLKDFKSRKK